MNTSETLDSFLHDVEQRISEKEPAENIRLDFLGRKGKLTLVLRTLGSMNTEDRSKIGKKANQIKLQIEDLLDSIESISDTTVGVDTSVPAFKNPLGTIHPISLMIEELASIFTDLSFEIVEGNELVTEYQNFDSLNISSDHPARDSHDTFFINHDLLLRTHTSSVQVEEMKRRMKNNELPIRFVVPGKTYRRDSDATHSPMFHQFEGVMIDTQTTFSDLKGILAYVATRLFGEKVETRFRTHYFPFTEPSAEIDIRWKNAQGTGKHTEWIEWLGCGMIHPDVLEHAGINSRVYQGWAFGGGVERPIMIRNQVPDLRKFFDNSIEFLQQFRETL